VNLSDARAGRMSLMVSDLRGSTALAERLSPRQTFALLNTYLAAFSKAVRDHGGFVLKYVGDGVLAVFPDGPVSAMRAAVSYTTTLDERAWDPLSAGTVNAGIAIHSGEVLFGVVGDGNRMQIDALSDSVNVTFRLETMTKRFGARVLISEDALNDIRPPETMPFRSRYLGEVETQGRQAMLRVYELIDAESARVREAKIGSLTAFEEGLRMFEQQDWVGACMNLGKVLRDNPGDQAALGLFQQAARRISEAK
jgi:two-component system sensor histidine kinase ChiS